VVTEILADCTPASTSASFEAVSRTLKYIDEWHMKRASIRPKGVTRDSAPKPHPMTLIPNRRASAT
jgi:hypothetical protein